MQKFISWVGYTFMYAVIGFALGGLITFVGLELLGTDVIGMLSYDTSGPADGQNPLPFVKLFVQVVLFGGAVGGSGGAGVGAIIAKRKDRSSLLGSIVGGILGPVVGVVIILTVGAILIQLAY